MNRRNFLRTVAVLSVTRKLAVREPMCADWMVECFKEKEIPGYVRKTVVWRETNLITGEWQIVDDA